MKWHLRLAGSAGVLFLLAAALADAQETKKDTKPGSASPDYYPMQVGNQWTYKIEVGGNSAIAIASIAKHETINDVKLARLDVTVNGKAVTSEHLQQNAKGIFRYRNGGNEISPPLCLLQYPVKSGAKWDGKITVGKETGNYFCEATEETIEHANEKVKTIKVAIRLESEESGAKKTVTTTYWFRENFGFVKQTVEAGNLNIAMEMQKFEPAKKKE
jgi:hypothetical protein